MVCPLTWRIGCAPERGRTNVFDGFPVVVQALKEGMANAARRGKSVPQEETEEEEESSSEEEEVHSVLRVDLS